MSLWVEEDGSLWTNGSGVIEGGRLRDIPSLFNEQDTTVYPTLWKPALPAASTSAPTLADEIAALADLHERGVLSDAEFQAAKRRLLAN